MTQLAVSILVQTADAALAAARQAAAAGADLVEWRIDALLPAAELPETSADSAVTGDEPAAIAGVPFEPAQPADAATDEDFAIACDLVAHLVDESPLPGIVTCRSSAEGGQFQGTTQQRLALYKAACGGTRQPAYLDVELQHWQADAALRRGLLELVDHPGQRKPHGPGLILSCHDFDGRIHGLYNKLHDMAADDACRVVKLAWRARSIRDNVEAFELILQHHKPTIALCMGEEGLMSRVLARKFGALLTFAALSAEQATAPGQPTIGQIQELYRWDQLGPATRVYGVIGQPVGHSMSPAIHNAGFAQAGFDGVYLPLPVQGSYEAFKAAMISFMSLPPLHFRGASVTIPHKENLLRFVAEQGGRIEPLAQRIGAANTLTVGDDGSLYASNSDYDAALTAVCQGMGIARSELAGKRVAVIGAGGAARAIVAGFAANGCTVVIYNRTFEKAQELAREFGSREVTQEPAETGTATGPSSLKPQASSLEPSSPKPQASSLKPSRIVAAPFEKLCASCCEIYINCTPLGMHPNVDQSPLPAQMWADRKSGKGGAAGGAGAVPVVFDTVYNPVETRLLREAKAAGCTVISGVEMFVRQAALQFALWTGQEAPQELFREIVLRRLQGNRKK